MTISQIRRQFIHSLAYKPQITVREVMRDAVPLISFPHNAIKFKAAFSKRLKWTKQKPLNQECSTLSLTRYIVTMVGLGVLLVPFRLIATYMDKPAVVKPQTVQCSLSRSVRNVTNRHYKEEIQNLTEPILDWNTGFVAKKSYFSTDEAVEDLLIPCGENPIQELVQEEIPPIDLTEECFLKVKLPSMKKNQEIDTKFIPPPVVSPAPPSVTVDNERESLKEPCSVKVKFPTQKRKEYSSQDLQTIIGSAPVTKEDKKSLTTPCFVIVKIPKCRAK